MNRHKTPMEKVECIVAQFLANPNALEESRKNNVFPPAPIQKPNVELFDDPTHNGQYWGE